MPANTSIWTSVTLMMLGVGAVFPETEPYRRGSRPTPIADQYREAGRRILDAVRAGHDGWDKLEELCLEIGPRLSGSRQLENAVEWAARRMQRDGQENVRRETVMVPHWVRGKESLTMLTPHERDVAMLGLGGSVGTPAGGITGEVVVVRDEEHLEQLALADVAGKIVLFNKAMPPYDSDRGSGYGETVHYRTHGARLAAAKGAIACLIRSVTASSLYTPHTGAMNYGDAVVRIPAAAVSIEDAETIARLTARGTSVRVRLDMAAQTLPDAPSANVIGELRGSSMADDIVVLSGHLDSWDVGHGAHDDGGGCVIAMEAINVLRKLKVTPRRTIRVVLWTNEENGLRGAKAYVEEHAHELAKHVAALETDSGIFEPLGFSVDCRDANRQRLAEAQMADIVTLLDPIRPMVVETGWSGADVGQMKDAGVMLLGHRVEGSSYFDYHHSHADTLDKVDPERLTQNIAALAVLAYIVADMPARLGEPLAGGTR